MSGFTALDSSKARDFLRRLVGGMGESSLKGSCLIMVGQIGCPQDLSSRKSRCKGARLTSKGAHSSREGNRGSAARGKDSVSLSALRGKRTRQAWAVEADVGMTWHRRQKGPRFFSAASASERSGPLFDVLKAQLSWLLSTNDETKELENLNSSASIS